MSDNNKILEISHLMKSFGNHEVLRDIDFAVEKGDVISIIGASGSGKSTMLRCVNLLETPTGGNIYYHGKDITDPKMDVCTYREKVGMVFQSFNLFANLTVLENCMVGPIKVAKKSKEEAKELAMKFLKKVGMDPYINAKPRQLSGGQKQRVAIARALVNDPEILLCDEATSALDPRITKEILSLLTKINKEMGITIVIVTHQMEVVKEICQRVAFLKHGVVLAEGKPEDLFVQPSADIKRFLGEESQTLPQKGVNIQLFFLDETSDEPVVTEMARDLNIDFSICWGKLEEFRSNVFGSLVINVQEENRDAVLKYLAEKNVKCEVL